MKKLCESLRQTPCLLRPEKGGKCRFDGIFAAETKLKILFDGAVLWEGTTPADGKVSVFLPEPKAEGTYVFTAEGDGVSEIVSVPVHPVRRWEVHLVQFSHHDPGYTDIPSHVLENSARQLQEAVETLEARADYPEDAKPRIVIEQAYSLYQFLRRACAEEKERMRHQIREGNIEVTALWANLISEILSPEEAVRALYPSAAVADWTGVPIVSAEHNDITGFTWGYSTLLSRAGVKYFLPGLPLYYSWGVKGYDSFWDAKAALGYDAPGAFWWESPEGERILLWTSNTGCGDEESPRPVKLFDELIRLEDMGWPHRVLRWQMRACGLDNYKYVADYSDFVKEWNETYASPRFLCSTDKKFCEAFLENLSVELPVHRGGIDGQDYPIASTSQMSSSSRARELHALFADAQLVSALSPETDASRLPGAVEDMLFADEHAYGFNAPADPRQLASYWEHGVYAARANADLSVLRERAAGAIAAKISDEGKNPRLTVFRTGTAGEACAVRLSLKNLKNQYLDGKFRLVDRETGLDVPYVLKKLAWNDAEPAAAVRTGVGAGTPLMGLFDPPTGYGYTLCFTANGIPPCGYRTYDLLPSDKAENVPECPAEGEISNEFYRISFDERGISDVTDLLTGKSMLSSAAPYRPGTVLVRHANDRPVPMTVSSVTAEKSDVGSHITVEGTAEGLYSLRVVFSLAGGVDEVSVTARVVKSSVPLQTVYMAFPFAGTGLRYQSVLHDTAPAKDTFRGSQSDVLAVQDWVCTEGSDILWNSANTPVVSLSHLWEGYISPAHRCILTPPPHPALQPEAFDSGEIYSILTCNNFGTNFFTAQLADSLYRYTFAARRGRDAALWGQAAAGEAYGVFSYDEGGTEKGIGTLLTVPGLRVLTLKPAEDGNGLILRVKNDSDEDVTARPLIFGKPVTVIARCALPERDVKSLTGSSITVGAGKLECFRIRREA